MISDCIYCICSIYCIGTVPVLRAVLGKLGARVPSKATISTMANMIIANWDGLEKPAVAKAKAKQNKTEAEYKQLAEKITAIDMRDGRADGKVTAQQKQCPKCSSMICARFNRCLFCGYEDPAGDPFNEV